MRFYRFILPLFGLGLVMTSCNLDNDDEENYITTSFHCSNLVIPGEGEAFATDGNYTMQVFTNTGMVTMGGNNINLGYGTFSFVTSPMQSTTKFYTVDWIDAPRLDVTTFSGGFSNTGGLLVQNLKGYTSAVFNYLTTNDPNNPVYPFNPYIPLVMSYTADQNYTVKTFMKDAIYRGTTTVMTPGTEGEPFTSQDVRYRIIFSKDYKTADVIFYNAKFADAMPRAINFLLENLEVKFTRNGYEISNPGGQPVVPALYSPNGWDPAPGYPFTSFKFINSSDDLTAGQCMYTVQIGPASYNCTFSGYYVLSGESLQ